MKMLDHLRFRPMEIGKIWDGILVCPENDLLNFLGAAWVRNCWCNKLFVVPDWKHVVGIGISSKLVLLLKLIDEAKILTFHVPSVN